MARYWKRADRSKLPPNKGRMPKKSKLKNSNNQDRPPTQDINAGCDDLNDLRNTISDLKNDIQKQHHLKQQAEAAAAHKNLTGNDARFEINELIQGNQIESNGPENINSSSSKSKSKSGLRKENEALHFGITPPISTKDLRKHAKDVRAEIDLLKRNSREASRERSSEKSSRISPLKISPLINRGQPLNQKPVIQNKSMAKSRKLLILGKNYDRKIS